MFVILAETHKLIAGKVHERIFSEYGIKLDEKKLKWGSIAPDYLPYYKFKRHYLDESLFYVAGEIVNLIYISRYVNLYNMTPFFKKFFSKKLGIIMHYLCDFTTRPHAVRMTCTNYEDLKEHLKYEKNLDEFSISHDFKYLPIEEYRLVIDEDFTLKKRVCNFILNVTKMYLEDVVSYKSDLNYAISMSYAITDFVLETILMYSEEMELQFV